MRDALRVLVLLVVVLVLGSGCAMGPDYARPAMEVPEEFVQPAAPDSSSANLPWWDLFQDAELDTLLRTALVQNKDLKIALARIDEARAVLGISRADQFPSIDYSGTAVRGKTSEEVIRNVGGSHTNFFALGAQLFYEADLWGRYRRATESSRAVLLSTEYAATNVTISLVANVASTYFLLRDLDARYAIARQTLASRQEALVLMRNKFAGGVIPELDVHQAEIQEAIAAAAVPELEAQVVQTENGLSILLGRTPGPIVRGLTLTEQVMPPEIPAGLPVDLLERRPDVRASEEALHAQTARIGVAQAARLPSISLTGAGGVESSDIDQFFTQGASFWNIGANLFGPLLDFGKRRSAVEVERARTEQAVAFYEQSVLQALREVEDALIAARTSRERYRALQRQVVAAQSTVRLAQLRYDGGVTSYLEVLDSERTLFDSQLSESQALQQQLVSIVQLYKALGGGWQIPEPEDQAAAADTTSNHESSNEEGP
jgi:multidrug efflux system outer membrane protein